MNKTENLWPSDSLKNFKKTDEILPKTILEEQAVYLEEVTDSKLKAKIRTSSTPSEMHLIHHFIVIASDIDFRFTLLTVTHNTLDLYHQLKISNKLLEEDNEAFVDNLEEYKTELEKVFKHPETITIIKRLLIQMEN